MIGRFFFVAGLIFLVACLCGVLFIVLFLQTPGSFSSAVPLKQPVCLGCGAGSGNVDVPAIIGAGRPGDLIVYDEWPKQVNYTSSDIVSLALTVNRNFAADGVESSNNISAGNYHINEFDGDTSERYFDALETEFDLNCRKKYSYQSPRYEWSFSNYNK